MLPQMPNNLGHFEPIHEAHAIEQVLFALQFERPLRDSGLEKARGFAEEFKEELPGRAEIQGVTFAIGAGGPVGSIPALPSSGVIRSRTAPDGTIENELRVEPASLTFRTTIYSRWKDVWSRSRKYFGAIAPAYISESRLTGISVNFVDKFIWTGSPEECKPSEMLRPGSDYLSPHVYGLKNLWHNHTGAFLRIDEKTKRLLNVNVDLLDENQPNGLRRVLIVRTVLTDLLNQPGYEASAVAAANIVDFVDTHIQDLHAFGKIVFGNIINDEMSKRIALTD